MAAAQQQQQQDSDRSKTQSDVIDEEFTDHDVPDLKISLNPSSMIPDLFSAGPPVRDALETETSGVQNKTVETILPFISGQDEDIKYNDHGVPGLDRQLHSRFLHRCLGKLPAPFVAADASRPWFLFWCLNALTLLGENVSPYRERLIETALSMQNETGGFGGGPGQLSHLATTYAVILALAVVGGEDCYEAIDRRALWRWLCRIKQADGGFRMSTDGEEDIRGGYCALVIISLLGLPLDLTQESPAWQADGSATLFTGLGEYVRRCQTFEGGMSGQPDAEAHGAYAFCALGCLSILDTPDRSIPKYLDVSRLMDWLSSRQYAPEGGFSGRTNKLVDGCYSHWVGGCWPLLEACLRRQQLPAVSFLEDGSDSLFSREGLIRYILTCCQDRSKRGGLRDKPGKISDAYHSCYVLSGLSSAEHKWELQSPSEQEGVQDGAGPMWKVSPYPYDVQIFDEADRVGTIHPVYTIAEDRVSEIQEYFLSKQGF